jgi:AcrR family transcriptional regulator
MAKAASEKAASEKASKATKATNVRKTTNTRSSSKATRRARGSLSREEILDGAQYLVEQQGLKQLSMPSLAKHLKSGVTSIYWYFRSKDDLITALTERAISEIYSRLPPVGDRPWDEEMVAYFTAFREELRRVPLYSEVFVYRSLLVMSRSSVNDAIFRRLEDEIAVLVRAGLTVEQAAHVYTSCSVFTRGLVMIEHGIESEAVDSRDKGSVSQIVSHLDPSEFPVLSKLDDLEQTMWPGEDNFQQGLQLLVEGLRKEFGLPTTRAPRRRPAAIVESAS